MAGSTGREGIDIVNRDGAMTHCRGAFAWEIGALMSTIAANEAKETLARLVQKSETGEDVVIVNRGEPLAQLKPPKSGHDVGRAVAAAERIMETARRIGSNNITLDEIRIWTREGHP